ncbi:hypothetical protein [Brevundimonas sp.]|uniref:hypothetical protein n=1 Tax=Brevundimonas sp. TaxID=1871086 RepID=UPI0028962EA3|nr:hypothetical protein [Brevundimonas sp.]
MGAQQVGRYPPGIILHAAAACLLILGLAFILFGLGLYVEGHFDLSDGRMDGHAALDLSEEVATYLYRRRVGMMLGWGGGLLLCSLIRLGIAAAIKPKREA